MSVGIRDLKNNLSARLAEVRSGQSITVTDHGRPIARIVPATKIDGDSVFERLLAEHLIRPPSSAVRPVPQPVKSNGAVTDLISDQRR